MGLYLCKRMSTPFQSGTTGQPRPVDGRLTPVVVPGRVAAAGCGARQRGAAMRFAREDSTRGDGAPVWRRLVVSGRKRTGAPGSSHSGARRDGPVPSGGLVSCLLPFGQLHFIDSNEPRGHL